MSSPTINKPKFSLKNILALLGLIGLCLAILFSRHQLTSFWQLLHDLRWYILLAIVAIQLFSYWLNALYYRSILKIFFQSVPTKRLFEAALAANFVNYIVPSAGLAGAGYLSQVLAPEIPRGESFLTQLTRYGLSALAVLIMMPVGLLIIFSTHNSDHPIIKVTVISAIAITLLVFAIIELIHRESALRRFVLWLTNKLKRFRLMDPSSTNHFIDEFYVGYRKLTNNKRRLLIPIGWSLIYIVIEIVTLQLAFVAFGRSANFGIVIMAYLFANIASIFGGVFFSIGTFEVGMAGSLVALGLPSTFAFSVTTVYRILNLLIGLPPGFYYYRKYLPKN